MNTVDKIKLLLQECTPEEKFEIFLLLRQEISIHQLEAKWNTKAEVVLEAISRATDLTQRGLRGIIAEAAFTVDIISTSKRWNDITPAGDLPYDCLVEDDLGVVRVQIKLQRLKKGLPWLAKDLRAFRNALDVFLR